MSNGNKTIFIFLVFILLLTQAFLLVNEKIQKNDNAFDEKNHADQNTQIIDQLNIVSNQDNFNNNQKDPDLIGYSFNDDNQVVWGNRISYKSLLSNLYEIPDLIKVNPEIEYINDYKIKDSNTAIIITDKNIYLKLNDEIKRIPLNGIPSNAYLTSCELTKNNDKYYIFVGTSYSGLFAKAVDDDKFYHFFLGIKRVFYTSEQSLLFETITALYSKEDKLFIGYQSSKGIDILDLNSYYFMRGSKNNLYLIKNANIELKDDYKQKVEKFYELEGNLYAFTNFGIYRYHQESFVLENEFSYDEKIVDDNIRGLYISPFAASSRSKIDKLINIAKYCDLNAFVVDFKDDYGYLSYGSNLEIAKKMRSSRTMIDLEYLLTKARENDIKIIARIVSFRDPIAFNYDNYKFALWSKTKNTPWSGTKSIEKWIDPYNEEYIEYLIEVAKEIEKLGVYELQFDYIRFPAEGNVQDILYRYNKNNVSKNVQLYYFLSKIKEKINIPISVDFFGYQCWYKISKHIGQDIYLVSNIVSAIYPMYYPSHFSKVFYTKGLNQLQSVKLIYKHGTIRAFENSNYKIAIRPWIQVFKLDVKEDFASYVKNEIEGVIEAGINSYIFWNPSCNYEVLYEVFKK